MPATADLPPKTDRHQPDRKDEGAGADPGQERPRRPGPAAIRNQYVGGRDAGVGEVGVYPGRSRDRQVVIEFGGRGVECEIRQPHVGGQPFHPHIRAKIVEQKA